MEQVWVNYYFFTFRPIATLLKIGGKETIRFSLFLAGFISSYKTILCFLRYHRKVNDNWNSAIAGLIAGYTLLLDSNKSRRLMIALYLSTRMLHFMSRFIWRHYIQPKIDPYSPVSPTEKPIEEDIGLITIPTLSKRNYGQLRMTETRNHRVSQDFYVSSESLDSPLDSTESLSIGQLVIDSKIIEYSKTKANFIRGFFRQSSAVLVMMISSSQILYSFIAEPDTLAVLFSVEDLLKEILPLISGCS